VSVQVELVSPERILYTGEADMVSCRTTEGEIAFLSNHAPFVGALGVAPLTISSPTGSVSVAVHGGFVEVRDNRVIVLSDVAELAEQIDVERARAAKDRAEAELRADADDARAAADLARATVRLMVAG
jgi:F-type H+-transporting ATPase subunit epsilon